MFISTRLESGMDIAKSSSLRILSSRLGNCEVCATNSAKYTCPECEVKTCSLSCVNIHKKELLCNGQRNKIKYIPLDKFTNMDLQSDYMLLEETGRIVKRVSANGRRCSDSIWNLRRINKLQKGALVRGIKLEFLPQRFTRHRENSTYLNWNTGELFWTIKWVFPEADNFTISDNKVVDSKILAIAAAKYTSKENISDQIVAERLKVFHNSNKNEIKILLKGEKTLGNKFYDTEIDNTISHNLRGKVIFEYPTFYVILLKNLSYYEIDHEVPDAMRKDKFFRQINGNKNFLFSTVEEEKNQLLKRN